MLIIRMYYLAKYNKYYKTACQINEVTLAENESFHMDYEVSYIYELSKGISFEVGVQTETGFYPFKRGKVFKLSQLQVKRFVHQQLIKQIYILKFFRKVAQLKLPMLKKTVSSVVLIMQNQSDTLIRLLYAELDNYFLLKV